MQSFEEYKRVAEQILQRTGKPLLAVLDDVNRAYGANAACTNIGTVLTHFQAYGLAGLQRTMILSSEGSVIQQMKSGESRTALFFGVSRFFSHICLFVVCVLLPFRRVVESGMSVRLDVHVVCSASDEAMLKYMREKLGFGSLETRAIASRFVAHYNGNLAGLRGLMQKGTRLLDLWCILFLHIPISCFRCRSWRSEEGIYVGGFRARPRRYGR